MARRQQNRAAQDSAVGRKILDRASKSVTSCNVDSPETKWCDSFSQSKGGKLYLAWRTFVLGSAVGFCTLCFCFPTKMLHLNAPFFPLKCSVSPKKSLKCSDNAHYTNGFVKINFKVYTYKNVQVLQVTTTTCTSS